MSPYFLHAANGTATGPVVRPAIARAVPRPREPALPFAALSGFRLSARPAASATQGTAPSPARRTDTATARRRLA